MFVCYASLHDRVAAVVRLEFGLSTLIAYHNGGLSYGCGRGRLYDFDLTSSSRCGDSGIEPRSSEYLGRHDL
jgi:hypothetical protein